MRRTGVAIIGVVALLSAFGAAPAGATFPGRDGAIIASFDDHSRPFVRAINPTTGAAHELFKCSKSDCPDFTNDLSVTAPSGYSGRRRVGRR
jgi:hypothetical protein